MTLFYGIKDFFVVGLTETYYYFHVCSELILFQTCRNVVAWEVLMAFPFDPQSMLL